MSEVAEKTAEVVAENVEDAIDGVVEVVEVFRSNPVALAAAGVVGIVAGAAGGYFVAKKILKRQYEDLATEEIAQAKEFYAGVYKTDEDGAVLTPQEVLENLHGSEAVDAVRAYRGGADVEHSHDEHSHDEQDEAQIRKIEERIRREVKEESPDAETTVIEEKVETINVFSDPTFDLEEELKYRTEDQPYIITHDEYFAAEKEYDTFALTYYEEDDTLVGEDDKPIDDVENTIGEDHLVRFGSGSKDKNIVYIRNDKLASDYEIVKTNGSYVEMVLGMVDEEPNSLKHSDQRDRRRAFRHGDE